MIKSVWLSILSAGLGVLLLASAPRLQPANAGGAVSTPEPDGVVFLPMVAKEWCPPRIEFTYVPAYAGFDNLLGKVGCVQPADYRVAVYIYVSGWWTKPYWAQPLTPIQSDGTWSTDITTGGTDQLATRIAAFLVPAGYDPPLAGGDPALPADLSSRAVAQVIVERPPVFRTIQFSGRTWNVKASESLAGPGPNYFSDSQDDVWVDESGRLHLQIAFRDGRWYCSEVFTSDPLGYGTYTFTLAGPVDELDPNVVLGLFTWDDTAPAYNYREIDIELSRWGQVLAENAQFVVQPWSAPGNLHRFDMALTGEASTHRFAWSSASVEFASHQGRPADLGDPIDIWIYTGPDVPPAGAGNARINLWLFNGAAPTDGLDLEVVVEAFQYVP